ncbi:MFS transporter [Pontibacter rufus]|uniref:MFS transporter n=1 Tax=Pontibacter rufus TaxID=2791028 RepID=UPI001E5DB930|nr:MFS transporter [Pontibacter sp. 172403-2]
MPSITRESARTAMRFVVLLGLVSLFSDMTYEAARSINGPYLNLLGRSGATVGWVAGLGELLGYGLRIISGYLADKTRKYWVITFAGYFLNLVSVPLLAFAGYWQLAVGLMIAERIGKAIRTPARDAMLSYGTHTMGRGWGFGLHEAMDQVGATLGPLLVSAVLLYKAQNYHDAYLVLLFPAIAALVILFIASRQYPNPEELELTVKTTTLETTGYPRKFWMYLLTGRGFYCRWLCRFPADCLPLQRYTLDSRRDYSGFVCCRHVCGCCCCAGAGAVVR